VPYSLWLLPPASVAADLQTVIDTLAYRLGTARFEPHITLVAVDEPGMLDRIARQSSVDIQPTVVADGEEFFRSIYLEVALTPELIALHQRASAIAGFPPAPFHPHLSLAYGSIPPEVRVEVTDELNLREFPPFRVAAVAAVDTRGEVGEWRTVESRIL
jgi:2'-5' RNA ligase